MNLEALHLFSEYGTSLIVGLEYLNGKWQWNGRISGEIKYSDLGPNARINEERCCAALTYRPSFYGIHCSNKKLHFACERINGN